MQRRATVLAFCITAFLAVGANGFANTISVTGDGNILLPGIDPVGMTANFFNDTGNPGDPIVIHGWDEVQHFVLSSSITLDFTSSGLHTGAVASENFLLSAGTVISSHYVYLDPDRLATRSATFEYDEDIIGVIVYSDLPGEDRLLLTDFLKNPFSIAPTAHFFARGFEAPDKVTIAANRRKLTFNITASSPGNQVRVITSSTRVPEPATFVLIGAGILGLFGVRRRAQREARSR